MVSNQSKQNSQPYGYTHLVCSYLLPLDKYLMVLLEGIENSGYQNRFHSII